MSNKLGLGMRKICAKMVIRNLTNQKRDAHLSLVYDTQTYYGDAAGSLPNLPRDLQILLIAKS
jgi:hypothetical protein